MNQIKAKPLMPLSDFRNEIEQLYNELRFGCGDGGCTIKQPTGMHTNGGCRCKPRDFSRTLLWLAEEMENYGYKYFPRQD